MTLSKEQSPAAQFGRAVAKYHAAMRQKQLDQLGADIEELAREIEAVSTEVRDKLQRKLIERFAETKMTKVDLAKRLGVDEKIARRLLDPTHINTLESLLAALRALRGDSDDSSNNRRRGRAGHAIATSESGPTRLSSRGHDRVRSAQRSSARKLGR